MYVLTAAVVLAGLLCALNLLLTVGVIKRLREHSEQLAADAAGETPPALGIGEEVGEFTTTTTEGLTIDRDQLSGETLVAFFSPNCTPCKKKLPEFVAYAQGFPGGRRRVLAVVSGRAEGWERFVEDLGPVAMVVQEDYNGPMGDAFRMKAFPSLFVVAPDTDGRLVVRDNRADLPRLPLAA